MHYKKKRIRKQFVSVTTAGLLSLGILLSCSKKDDPQPDSSSSSNGTASTTTSGTTGGTTGGTTNNLGLNTWQKGSTTYTTSTANIFALAFNGKNQYYISCVDNNNSMNSLEVFLYSNAGALPATGTYTVINGLANQTATLTPNQAFLNIPGNGGGASAGTGTLAVTNTNSVLTVIGTNIPFSLLPSGSTSVSLNIQK